MTCRLARTGNSLEEVTSLKAQACKDCVKILTDALKRARAGEIHELALVEMDMSGSYRTEWTAYRKLQLVGGLERVKSRILASVDETG